tara:strand:- start:573 stop:1106 length:534 start_codon:yes stop_codon:yes gene_type:complete
MKKLLIIFIILFGFSSNLYSAGGSSGGSSGGTSNSSGSSGGYGGSGMSGQYTVSTRGVYDATLMAIWKEIEDEMYQSAHESLQSYVIENPENSDGWNLFGFTSRKLEIFNDAEKYYQIGLEIDPEHTGILQYQGELYLETDRLNLAKNNLKRLEELCVFNCDEKNKLAELISKYESK